MSQEPAAAQEREPITPRDSFREAAVDMRRPFTENAVKWKVQSEWGGQPPKGALIVAYIDARLVIERLNALVPHLWFAEYLPVDGHREYIECRLTIRSFDSFEHLGDLTRSDVGTGSDPKARRSDALKRAAVHFGIGVSLYAIPRMLCKVGENGLELTGREGKKRCVIKPNTETWLRQTYAGWLEIPQNSFGRPLDHGDVEDAVGDVDAPELEGPTPASEPEGPPSDERAEGLVGEARGAWTELPPTAKRKLTHTALEQMLANTTTHEDLEAVVAHVKGLGE